MSFVLESFIERSTEALYCANFHRIFRGANLGVKFYEMSQTRHTINFTKNKFRVKLLIKLVFQRVKIFQIFHSSIAMGQGKNLNFFIIVYYFQISMEILLGSLQITPSTK